MMKDGYKSCHFYESYIKCLEKIWESQAAKKKLLSNYVLAR